MQLDLRASGMGAREREASGGDSEIPNVFFDCFLRWRERKNSPTRPKSKNTISILPPLSDRELPPGRPLPLRAQRLRVLAAPHAVSLGNLGEFGGLHATREEKENEHRFFRWRSFRGPVERKKKAAVGTTAEKGEEGAIHAVSSSNSAPAARAELPPLLPEPSSRGKSCLSKGEKEKKNFSFLPHPSLSFP